MEQSDIDNIKILHEGEIRFEKMTEGGFEDIVFKEPLIVKYLVFDIQPDYAYVDFDFGMSITIPITKENNWLISGYNKLSETSSMEDIIKTTLIFDLFHAFTHDIIDPNYNTYHWAIYGNLKDRVELVENKL